MLQGLQSQAGNRAVSGLLARPLTVQRLILHIGTPEKDASTDYPTIASKMLTEKLNEKSVPWNMYNAETSIRSDGAKGQTGNTGLGGNTDAKETVYIVAHGTDTGGIIGFDTADELAAALRKKKLTSDNVSKIVLVCCSAGQAATGADPTSFAKKLAAQLSIDVYAPADLITVWSTQEKTGGWASYHKPMQEMGFTVKGIKVGVVEGEGLSFFSGTSPEGYSPPKL